VKSSKPACSLSLDLDNQWSYMKTHGDPEWESFPSYLDVVVPRFLNVLDDLDWKITGFVVGQDAALEKNREALEMIAAAGHEIGNHSFNHEPWLELYSKKQIEEEIIRAEEAIESATGRRPRGFRGPGYSLSEACLEILKDRDYLYDASTFPTFLGPLARTYYFLKSDLEEEEKEKRKQLFGGFRDGLKPVKPYFWALGTRTLLEIPVTTMPIVKVPFHFSYILYLATVSHHLAHLYFKSALMLCHLNRVEPSLLLHPLDFLDGDDVPALRFFPAMGLPAIQKDRILRRMFQTLSKRRQILAVEDHAHRALAASDRLALRS